ncbi:hypothetical protein AOLI_G00284910 [Acnodon oligacanthus]
MLSSGLMSAVSPLGSLLSGVTLATRSGQPATSCPLAGPTVLFAPNGSEHTKAPRLLQQREASAWTKESPPCPRPEPRPGQELEQQALCSVNLKVYSTGHKSHL